MVIPIAELATSGRKIGFFIAARIPSLFVRSPFTASTALLIRKIVS